jgi:sugar O-acyltransferase (sialic acid O-acetyltransferase NeuD family)
MVEGSFVLFGTGSSILVEYVATCRRLGLTLAAGVVNRDGPSYLPSDVDAVGAAEVPDALLTTPCLCPLFTPANRRVAVEEASRLGFRFPSSLIDPTAVVADDFETDGGCFLNAGVIVGACTSLGAHVIVNRGASIGHHSRIGDFASLGPGAILAGHVTVAAGAMIGAGAIVLPGLAIGENAIVGAGSIVSRDVPANGKAMGVAARLVDKDGLGAPSAPGRRPE